MLSFLNVFFVDEIKYLVDLLCSTDFSIQQTSNLEKAADLMASLDAYDVVRCYEIVRAMTLLGTR